MAFYSEARSNLTGTKVIIGLATELALCPEAGRWVTVCDKHNTVCNHKTLAVAKRQAPWVEWCKDCMKP